MSTEPDLIAPAPSTPAASAIENEIATYRAISPLAVFSLIAGVLSVLSFASWPFLAFAVLAVLLGVLALGKIKRFPDALTGRGIAQAGLALGLVFGLTAFTISTVQSLLTLTQARSFASTYATVLKRGSFEELLWYGQHPKYREGKTPEMLATEMRAQPKMAEMFETKFAAYRMLSNKVTRDQAAVHFERIETHGQEGMDPFAVALYEVDDPRAKDPAGREQFLMVLMKGVKGSAGRPEWYIDEVRFPYQPSSYVVLPKKADDGHGHEH